MKSYFTLFIIIFSLCCTSVVFGQKTTIKKESDLVNNTPYCIINCKGTEDCNIKTLDGKIIASLVLHEFKLDNDRVEGIYEITFLNTHYKIQMKEKVNFTKTLLRKLYKYEVLKDGQLNEIGLQNLAKAYNQNLITERNNNTSNTTNTTIKSSN